MYKEKFKEISPDFLVPVPIHSKRLRERNFNQAEVLAFSIKNELKKYNINIDVNTNLIYRTKNTKYLNKLDSSDRSNELNGAFEASDLTGIDKIIIVDDIYTTGSTINQIAYVLKQAGAKKVYFVAIAIVDNL
jgi:ComF family protein